MSTQAALPSTIFRPDFSRLYGITHDAQTHAAIDRTPRTVKVGIGELAGKDMHVAMHPATGKWMVRVGADSKQFETIGEAKRYYRDQKTAAPDRRFPTKLAYFTFSKVAPDGGLEPDWDAIEKHGPTPTELEIVFADDTPLQNAFEMWAAGGLLCRGDGLNALRSLNMDPTKESISQDGKNFPIMNGCSACGCNFRLETIKNGKAYPAACKPHGRLAFQLVNDIRLGGKAVFDTTSFRSINNLYSSIQSLKRFTGGGDPERGFIAGIPLRMLLRPFKTSHKSAVDGKTQSGKAYCVSLEFRTEGLSGIRQKILAYGAEFRTAMQAPAPAITAPVLPQIEAREEESELTDVEQAAAFHAEFSDELESDDVGDPEDELAVPGSAEKAAEVGRAKLSEMKGQEVTASEFEAGKEQKRKRTPKAQPEPIVELPTPPAVATGDTERDLFNSLVAIPDRRKQLFAQCNTQLGEDSYREIVNSFGGALNYECYQKLTFAIEEKQKAESGDGHW